MLSKTGRLMGWLRLPRARSRTRKGVRRARVRVVAVALFAALAVMGMLPSGALAFVYWPNTLTNFGGGTTLGRAELDGSGTQQNFITGASSPDGVAVDAGHFY